MVWFLRPWSLHLSVIFFDSEPELTTKLNNNTHQAQTKVGQMTDYTLHNRMYFGFIFLKIDIAHAKVDINIGK